MPNERLHTDHMIEVALSARLDPDKPLVEQQVENQTLLAAIFQLCRVVCPNVPPRQTSTRRAIRRHAHQHDRAHDHPTDVDLTYIALDEKNHVYTTDLSLPTALLRNSGLLGSATERISSAPDDSRQNTLRVSFSKERPDEYDLQLRYEVDHPLDAQETPALPGYDSSAPGFMGLVIEESFVLRRIDVDGAQQFEVGIYDSSEDPQRPIFIPSITRKMVHPNLYFMGANWSFRGQETPQESGVINAADLNATMGILVGAMRPSVLPKAA